jgi:hypothetical protein
MTDHDIGTTSDDDINQYQISQMEPPEPDHPMVILGLTEQQWRDLCDREWRASDGTQRVPTR